MNKYVTIPVLTCAPVDELHACVHTTRKTTDHSNTAYLCQRKVHLTP